MANKNKSNQWFPSIDSLSSAKSAARQGFWAALFVAGMSTIFALAASAGSLPEPLNQVIDESIWIDVVIFVVVAWGIYCMSRVAAIAGLALYVLGRIYIWSTLPPNSFWQILLALSITLTFVNAVRGTFSYHALLRK